MSLHIARQTNTEQKKKVYSKSSEFQLHFEIVSTLFAFVRERKIKKENKARNLCNHGSAGIISTFGIQTK